MNTAMCRFFSICLRLLTGCDVDTQFGMFAKLGSESVGSDQQWSPRPLPVIRGISGGCYVEGRSATDS